MQQQQHHAGADVHVYHANIVYPDYSLLSCVLCACCALYCELPNHPPTGSSFDRIV